jgi:hypothetical protein
MLNSPCQDILTGIAGVRDAQSTARRVQECSQVVEADVMGCDAVARFVAVKWMEVKLVEFDAMRDR